MRERESYRELILENIEYDYLCRDDRLDHDMLNELVELMADTIYARRETIRIAGDDYPAEVVKSRFLKLNSSHIEYVLDRMRDNTTYVRNIKKYLLAALYNAPATIDSYYASLVNHDLYGKLGPRKTESCGERRSCGANELFAFRRKRVIQSQRRRKGDDVLYRKKSSSAPLPSAWRPQSSPPGCCSRP